MDSRVEKQLKKLQMIGAHVIGYNDWGILTLTENTVKLIHLEQQKVIQVPGYFNWASKFTMSDYFIDIETQQVSSKIKYKEAIYARYYDRDLLARNSGLYTSDIKYARNIGPVKVIKIRAVSKRTITLINYKGKRKCIELDEYNDWGRAHIRVSKETGKHYFFADGRALAEIDVDLNYITEIPPGKEIVL